MLAPTIQYPPIHKSNKIIKSTSAAPSKYPATEENTTLTDNLSLVISVKFLTHEVESTCVCVTDNRIYLNFTLCFECAKIRYNSNSNQFITTLKWLNYIIKFRPNVINLTGYQEMGTLPVLLLSKLMNIKTIMTNESVYSKVLHKKSLAYYFKYTYKRIVFLLTDGFFSYGIKSNDFLFRHSSNGTPVIISISTLSL